MGVKNISLQNLLHTFLWTGILFSILLPSDLSAENFVGIPPPILEELNDPAVERDDTWKQRVQDADKICAKVSGYSIPIAANQSAASLMVIYANGEGVERNLKLALHLACIDNENYPAPLEYLGRIEHLNQMLEGEDTNPFDYCDDATSGRMIEECTIQRASINGKIRAKQLTQLISNWPKRDQQAFTILRATLNNYLDSRAGEFDLRGTSREAGAIEDRETLENMFLASLIEFEEGKFPRFSESDFVRANDELNQAYQHVINNTDEESLGAVSKRDVRATQRAWLKFRDAWIIFAKQKYPSVDAAAWKAWLTHDRTEQLRNIN